jgi:uncharacterized membrane protein YdbT with pleckstrin-like domain
MEEATYKISNDDVRQLSLHRMVVMQPGEKVVCIIDRHPIGIIQQYVAATFAIVVLSVIVLLTIPGKTSSGTQTFFYAGLLVLVLVLVAVLGAATRVYWENHWVITTDSLTQVTQGSLFGAQASSLSLEHLEDITVDQHGILQRMLNYGTLKAETAGDHSKFQFAFCPEPLEYARKIIDAKEKYLAGDRR